MRPTHQKKWRQRVEIGRLMGEGHDGAFKFPRGGVTLCVIASDGAGWEHVSVSLPTRTPTWEEMAFIKDLFFEEEECVMQLHPPASYYVNNHPHCLHLWRPRNAEIPQPPAELVGIKSLGIVTGRDPEEIAVIDALAKSSFANSGGVDE